jgi:hypothetical protein
MEDVRVADGVWRERRKEMESEWTWVARSEKGAKSEE